MWSNSGENRIFTWPRKKTILVKRSFSKIRHRTETVSAAWDENTTIWSHYRQRNVDKRCWVDRANYFVFFGKIFFSSRNRQNCWSVSRTPLLICCWWWLRWSPCCCDDDGTTWSWSRNKSRYTKLRSHPSSASLALQRTLLLTHTHTHFLFLSLFLACTLTASHTFSIE